MYTVIDDKNLADKIRQVQVSNPCITRKELTEKFSTTEYRLRMLERSSLIDLKHTRRRK
jgi:hypothetical protein